MKDFDRAIVSRAKKITSAIAGEKLKRKGMSETN